MREWLPKRSRKVAPRTGAWIETYEGMKATQFKPVAPRTGAWIETALSTSKPRRCWLSPPARGRGLKLSSLY